MEPWICPRCQTVHAWWVARCDCPPPTTVSTGTVTYPYGCTCGTFSTLRCPIHQPELPHQNIWTAAVTVGLAVLLLFFAVPAFAQQNLTMDVVAERNKFPPGKISGAQIGQILNAVVAQHVAEGWRLMKKSGGNTCPQPLTGISMSCDILLHPPSGHWVDVLGDAEGDGSGVAAPSWQDHAGGDMSMALLPVDVGGPPSPVPVPVPTPIPPPAPIDLSGVLSRLEWVDANGERRFLYLKGQVDTTVERLASLAEQLEAHDDKAGLLEKTFENRYVQIALAIIGTIVTQQQVTK